MYASDLQADPAVVRAFFEAIHDQAARALNGANDPGLLQLVRVHPADGSTATSRFTIGDVDQMVEAALGDASAGHNVYVEGRTVAKNTKGRGLTGDTRGVFAFAVDSDADKGKAGKADFDASLTVETSPGNSHRWLFLDRALPPDQARPIGDAIRAATGADSDTGVITQPYRVAGTPNFPDAKKVARGRVCTSTRILDQTGTLWTPEALLAAFPAKPRPNGKANGSSGSNGSGGPGKAGLFTPARVEELVSEPVAMGGRSERFFAAACYAAEGGMTLDELEDLMRQHPEGCASKYLKGRDRLRKELERVWPKAEKKVAEDKAGTRRNAVGPDEALDEAADLDGGPITQDGLARVFAQRYAGRLRYDHHTGAWFEYDGVHWRRDERERAFQFVRALGREMSDGEKDGVKKEVRKVQFAAGVEKMSRGDEALAVTSEEWDQDPYLLGTPGGTVDLRTGELRPANPAEGITKLAAVAPAETADCPRFLRFLEETFDDEDAISFVQRWAGYCLTGDIREHALVFGEGAGGNGKSVLLNVLAGVMGDYATTAAMDTFTASKFDKHTTDVAMLRGARLVTASETEEGRFWAAARIKSLTGGEPITARFMRQDNFTFRPTFKLFVIGNHRPALQNVDDAMRRRLNILSFHNRPAVPDPGLEEKLKTEWPGILRWIVDGCLEWQREGLAPPESVKAASADYFDNQDLLGEWLAEECRVDPRNDHLKTTLKDLFDGWSAFARVRGEDTGTAKDLRDRLIKLDLVPCKNVPTGVGSKRARGFYGIELLKEPPEKDWG
jgi:putative DNA primase/helicase